MLAPAIRVRRERISRSPRSLPREWAGQRGAAARRRRAPARVYLPGGRPPRVGEIFSNPDLARTLSRDRRGRAATRSIAATSPAHRRAAPAQHGGALTPPTLPSIERRMGDAALDDLSRLDGLRAAAERPGHRRADDAQPARARSRSATTATTPPRRCTRSSRRRSWPTPTWRATSCDPALPRRAGRGDAVEGVRRASARARSIRAAPNPERRAGHAADARRRHDLL